MKARTITLLAMLVVQTARLGSVSVSQDLGPAVRTRFEKDASLTDQQVQTVIQLAKTCGLTNPVEITVGHTRPLARPFLVVKGEERRTGQRSLYERVDVWFSKWTPTLPRRNPKELGDFWVEPPYLVGFQFISCQVEGKPVTVQVSDEVTVEVAVKILSAFAEKKVQHPSNVLVDLEMETAPLTEPKRLTFDRRLKEYEVYFGTGLNHAFSCKLIGDDVVVAKASCITY